MLKACNLQKKYGSLNVINDVSVEITKGEVIAITGASGAGKSTLLHLLGALDKPDSGIIHINNIDVLSLPPKKQAAFRNKELGFVFQFHHLLPEFTAVENTAMPLLINNKGKKEAFSTAEKILEMVGLGGRINNKPSELSGGEQQRVAIARALVNNPSIVMADEPTGNLDSNNARAVHELFLQLRAQLGLTVIFITHNEELAASTDRVLMMRDGRIIEERKRGF